MVNMIKILVAVSVVISIIGIALLGKKLKHFFSFKTAKTPHKESLWLELVSGGLVLFIATAYYLNKRPDATGLMWSGVAVFFFGGLLQLFARKQLHNDKTFEERLSSGFSAAQTGIYKRIRHPSKAALLLLLLGFSLSMGSFWATALWFIFFLPSVLFRISQEERSLQETFNDRWLTYKSDTRKLIPGVL